MPADLLAPPETLTHGQPISRADFIRITEAHPSRYRHVERLDGRAYENADSGRRTRHSLPRSQIVGLLGYYYSRTPGTEPGDNGTAQIVDDHDPQPDAYLLIRPECGGQTRFTDDDYIQNAPELIVEIAGSSLGKDLGRLKEIYEADGCREYLVWATARDRVFAFRNGPHGFEPSDPADGVFRSGAFPGLGLDLAALVRGDIVAAFETLNAGLATPEHAAFVAGPESSHFTD